MSQTKTITYYTQKDIDELVNFTKYIYLKIVKPAGDEDMFKDAIYRKIKSGVRDNIIDACGIENEDE